ncbi:YdiK family protein [Amphibacillus sp. MSJ-3]|uniref:YdiK family protein n=1 Tax=Amphibacillus sp. MSJ-3 TaxID=2841505 RepID=UPI001C0ED0EF|nr:YdiK family protein [Amphibacillus sp. MSJ-3]MBU5595345.1 YdiK family protein [Amphibacillus sp. MSJ-3]
MRVSPLLNAFFYLIIGAIFVYFAFQSIEDTVFNPVTIILTVVASLDFGVSIRLFQLHFKIKRNKK